jgi:hypothetical protein
MIDGGAEDLSPAGAAKPDQRSSDGSLEPRIVRLAIVVGEGGRTTPGRRNRKGSFAARD